MALTPRQKELLDFIAGFGEANGFCPSFDEIARGLHLASLATVHKHVGALEGKGYLRRSRNQSRSLELGERYFDERPGSRRAEVPVEGRIAAGAPIESYASPATLAFSDFASNAGTYALQVRGDSMIEDHICDGDYVLVQRTAEARNGDIVVAMIGGVEGTLKRFFHEPHGMVRLQPANSSMEPRMVRASEVEIQGKLLAVLRKY